MENDNHDERAQGAIERIREEPLLGSFANPLPTLVEAYSDDLGRTFARLGELIGVSDDNVILSFRIGDEADVQIWSLETGPNGCNVTTDRPTRADVEVQLEAETWSQIAAGSTSPLEAFGRGRMRVRGDVRIARRIVRQILESGNEEP